MSKDVIGMATPVIMQRLGQSVETCILVKWYKQKGDEVKPGDLLFSYETDKAAFEETAEVGGTLLEVYYREGDEINVLATVCVIGEPGEDISSFGPAIKQEESMAEAPDDAVRPESPQEESNAHADSPGAIKISPRARHLAEQKGVDYRTLVPSGPGGRIIERDVQAAASAGAGDASMAGEKGAPAAASASSAGPEYRAVALTHIRKLIAGTMRGSLAETAQLTLHASFDASGILAYRKRIKEQAGSRAADITLGDMILFAVSRTLLRHPELNAHLVGEEMRYFPHVHLGVAIDTERGLMVPTIVDADRRTLSELAAEVKRLALECRQGNIDPERLAGGSFTVTNLGPLGIESFTPVLNPPQTGILGVGCAVQRARQAEGAVSFYPAMGLSLTFDHRALDGAPAARFLQDLRSGLEEFTLMLAG